MRYGSVCSGIEAATVAWHPLGWKAAWFAEIDTFPSAVLAHHYPEVPNLGDMTAVSDLIRAGEIDAPDLLVGGTPCQSFSVAGLRKSLADDRGNLALQFIRIADAIDDIRRNVGQPAAWILWENVPGVLSVRDNAFGTFLAGLCGCDDPLVSPNEYGWSDAGVVAGPERWAAWRVLDSQHLGLAQRRRRVFVLARGGSDPWTCADALLPIIESVRWNPPPSREKGERPAPTIAARTRGGGGLGTDTELDGGLIEETCVPEIAATLTRGAESSGKGGYAGRRQEDDENLVAMPRPLNDLEGVSHALNGKGTAAGYMDASVETFIGEAMAFHENQRGELTTSKTAGTLKVGGGKPAQGYPAVAFNIYPASGQGSELEASETDIANTVSVVQNGAMTDRGTRVVSPEWAVRRLTVGECLALQGFPRDYLDIEFRGRPAADGPKYKATGNSFATTVVRYIGEQIERVRRTNDEGLT